MGKIYGIQSAAYSNRILLTPDTKNDTAQGNVDFFYHKKAFCDAMNLTIFYLSTVKATMVKIEE